MLKEHPKTLFFKLISARTSSFRCYNSSFVYEIKNSLNQKIWYCLQDDLDGINLYRCSYPPYYEPQAKCKLKAGHNLKFEVPSGNTEYIKKIKEWIYQNTKQ